MPDDPPPIATLASFLGYDAAGVEGQESVADFVKSSREVVAGTGLDGGGALSADVTMGLDSASVASLNKADSALQEDTLPTTTVTIDRTLATPRYLKDKIADLPFVQDWGALGDGDNDDLASFQKAVDSEDRVFLLNYTYVLDGSLLLPTKQQLHGFGPSNTDSLSQSGSAKLLFTGAHGLDATKYGLFCYDEWEDQYEPVMATRTNDAGEEELYDTGERTLVLAAGNRYGVRYEEALAIEAAYQRHRIAALEAKLAGS